MQILHRELAIFVLAASVLAAGALALVVIQLPIQGTGSFRSVGLGLYSDPGCTNTTSSVNFGRLEPGSSKNFTFYLRNEGTSALALSMAVEDWSPSYAADYLTLTWNRGGQQINPDEVVGFAITLIVSENIQGVSSFSVEITITGTG